MTKGHLMTTATRAAPRTISPAEPLGPFPLHHDLGRRIVGAFFLVWVWSIPALAVLVPLALRDLRTSKEALS
ncbi:hypothetical protein [Nocardioides sp. Root140]|uniref:hypothetical protein n=1 Tax=Nocardioides sp. Root140 TaxID=1736460 RepID=UPI0007006530|nr:hypothetical protein [Nocardioides sp. Root140]KQY64442.1 hypothetical protein ASD30_05785 [Nocardioides sp. Root140]